MTTEELLQGMREIFPAEMLTVLEHKITLTVPWSSLILDGWLEKMVELQTLASTAIDQDVISELTSWAEMSESCMKVCIYLHDR